MTTVYFSLGSNVGERQKFLADAINALREQVSGLSSSPVYQTEPWGNENQPRFLNMCAKGRTSLPPIELLHFIKAIETKLGRVHTERWGPREIDIDIIFYGDKIIKSDELNIPHPQLNERAFVLIPLVDIAPDFIHPELLKPVSELAGQINSSGVQKYE